MHPRRGTASKKYHLTWLIQIKKKKLDSLNECYRYITSNLTIVHSSLYHKFFDVQNDIVGMNIDFKYDPRRH